jgi:hypothetical protein
VRHQPLVPHRWPESAEGLPAGAIRQGVAGRRREEMLDRLKRTRAALQVLDDKIAYYSAD